MRAIGWDEDLEPLAEVTKKVFMDVQAETPDGPSGRIVFGLYGDLCPRTAENFRALCTGETGKSYVGSPFHRIFWDFMAQAGDIERGDGTGGSSIYGGTFEDEALDLYHDRPGLLGMANNGPDSNGSQFYITTAPTPWLDGDHVIFGEVLEGRDVVVGMETCTTQSGEPQQRIVIAAAGEL